MFCAVCAPLTLFLSSNYNWHFGRILCRITPTLQMCNALVSCFSMALIAIDRWQLIVHSSPSSTSTTCASVAPNAIDPTRNTKITWIVISLAFIWLLALGLTTPLTFIRDVREAYVRSTNELIMSVCEETWIDVRFKYVYSFVLIMFHYILPIIIIGKMVS